MARTSAPQSNVGNPRIGDPCPGQLGVQRVAVNGQTVVCAGEGNPRWTVVIDPGTVEPLPPSTPATPGEGDQGNGGSRGDNGNGNNGNNGNNGRGNGATGNGHGLGNQGVPPTGAGDGASGHDPNRP